MAEKEKLEVAEGFVYNPTLENKGLPIVGNLTSPPPRAATTHFILELITVMNSHGVGEQALAILCPKKKNWRWQTGMFITPHSQNEDCRLWVI